MKKTEQAKVLFFGLGGHHIDVKVTGDKLCKSYTISGYDSPEHFNLKDHYKCTFDDCLVIDKREVLEKNPMFSIISPMCNPNLEDDQVDRCPIPSALMVWGLEGQFKQLAEIRRNVKSYTGLDYISPAEYTEWWRSKGARIGKIINGKIEWQEPEPKPQQSNLFKKGDETQ